MAVRGWGIVYELNAQAPILVGQNWDYPGPRLAPGIIGRGERKAGLWGAAESSRNKCGLGWGWLIPTQSLCLPVLGVHRGRLEIESSELG